MTIPLTHYAKIKDEYCITYLGLAGEYLLQLLLLRPNMEHRHDGVRIYIVSNDNQFHLLRGQERVLPASELKDIGWRFAHIYSLTCNLQEHPVEALLAEADVPVRVDVPPPPDGDGRCVLYPEGIAPTVSLTARQIEQCRLVASQRGLRLDVGGNLRNASHAMGVENEYLFAAAAHGLPTTLIPNGLGTNLYRNMFLTGEVLEIAV